MLCTIWTMLADSFTCEPFAAVKAMHGLSAANDWRNDSRLASRRLYWTEGTNQLLLSYDDDGYARLTSYVRTGSGTLTFTYNGLDDRVAMELATGTRRFIYDPDGRVTGEYGASAIKGLFGHQHKDRKD